VLSEAVVLAISEVGTLYIEPGSPWENAYAGSFIGRFGDELLKREAFAGLVEAKVLVEDYRQSTITTVGRTALWATGRLRSWGRRAGRQA
jgi:hypothetical protein